MRMLHRPLLDADFRVTEHDEPGDARESGGRGPNMADVVRREISPVQVRRVGIAQTGDR